MHRIERIGDASFRRGARGRQRSLPAQFVDLAAELARPASRKELFSAKPVPARGNNSAFGNEPDTRVAITDIEDFFTGFEASCGTACKADRERALTRRQRWKELGFSIFQQHERNLIVAA